MKRKEILFECKHTGLQLLRPSTDLDTVRDGRGVILTWVPENKIVELREKWSHEEDKPDIVHNLRHRV